MQDQIHYYLRHKADNRHKIVEDVSAIIFFLQVFLQSNFVFLDRNSKLLQGSCRNKNMKSAPFIDALLSFIFSISQKKVPTRHFFTHKNMQNHLYFLFVFIRTVIFFVGISRLFCLLLLSPNCLKDFYQRQNVNCTFVFLYICSSISVCNRKIQDTY